ncbi:MAG: RNA polymerase sigma factor [Lachnospiraceae bacterium]|jgi:RNA polymerase sigma-70 factor (ECF subfamily)|nr:RNA polymerase sigma factor [Lachnospiraceae bacterium]
MENNEYSDDELYQNYCDGDMEAFDDLIRRYDESLMWYLYGILQDYQDAEDMMVEAFAKLLEKRPVIRNGNFKAYLFKTARNLAVNYRKHFRRQEEFSLVGMEEQLPSGESLEAKNVISEQRTILYRCLNRMEKQLKEILYLVYLDGLSYSEVSQIMKVSKRRAAYLLERGKMRMREELEKEGVKDFLV